jgi:hypothetical protein
MLRHVQWQVFPSNSVELNSPIFRVEQSTNDAYFTNFIFKLKYDLEVTNTNY